MWRRRIAWTVAGVMAVGGVFVMTAAWRGRHDVAAVGLRTPAIYGSVTLTPWALDVDYWQTPRDDPITDDAAGLEEPLRTRFTPRWSYKSVAVFRWRTDAAFPGVTGNYQYYLTNRSWRFCGFGYTEWDADVIDSRRRRLFGGSGVRPEWDVFVPPWFVLAVAFAPLSLLLVRARRRGRRLLAGCCPSCGYDLRGTPDRCPECGAVPRWSRSEAVGEPIGKEPRAGSPGVSGGP